MNALKTKVATLAIFLGSTCQLLYAQDSLIGKYSETYTRNTNKGEQRYGLELNIESSENGVVKGTAIRNGRDCRGAFPVEGTFKDNRLELKSGKVSGAEDCTANLRLAAEGNKLKGTMGNAAVELSK